MGKPAGKVEEAVIREGWKTLAVWGQIDLGLWQFTSTRGICRCRGLVFTIVRSQGSVIR